MPAVGERPLVLLAAMAVAALIVAPTALAPLGPVDDHEIVRMARGEFLPLLEETRFRPLYYALRNAEGSLWGANPAGWAVARLTLGTLTVLLAYALARRYAPPSVALPLSLLVIAGPQAEAFYRFGPQEAYGMPLLLGAVLGVLSGRPWPLALAVAAAFTKETFVLAAGPLLAFAWWRGYRREAAIAGAFVAAAAVGVAMAALNGGAATGGTRLLLPWLIIPIAAVVRPALFWPKVVTAALAVLVSIGLTVAQADAIGWANANRAFQDQLVTIRSISGPLVVHATADDYERALSLPVWLPGVRMMLAVEPCFGLLCERLQRVSREGGHGYAPLAGGIDVRL